MDEAISAAARGVDAAGRAGNGSRPRWRPITRRWRVPASACASGWPKRRSAEIEFSTGDQFVFDFRFRVAEVDDGYLHRDAPEPRLINLPSGETFTAAYEGERGVPSLTSGVLPVRTKTKWSGWR